MVLTWHSRNDGHPSFMIILLIFAFRIVSTGFVVGLLIVLRLRQRKLSSSLYDNSQPNGRRMDSQSPTHYHLPQFKTIFTPKSTLASEWIKPWCWLWAMKWVNNRAETLFQYAISRSASCRFSRSKTADMYFKKDMPSFINLNSVRRSHWSRVSNLFRV